MLRRRGRPPFWPWIQAIRAYIQQADVAQLTKEMGPGAAEISEIVAEIRSKLPDLEMPPGIEPEAARFRLFDSITTFLKNVAGRQPLMLVLDDLHWADRSSLLLLQFLARQLDVSRLLVACCNRHVELSRQHPLAETVAGISRESVFRRVVLRGLSKEDTGQYIDVTAGIQTRRELVETIYGHTESDPFLMAEVVRLLYERGELSTEKIARVTGLRLPEGVREVIGQRLNRLSQRCNDTLTIASVVGREFALTI